MEQIEATHMYVCGIIIWDISEALQYQKWLQLCMPV